MKALVMRSHGDLSHLEVSHVPDPRPPEHGEVVVRLRASALNHLDLWTLKGLPGLNLTFPHILGADGAGIVESVGPAVKTVAPGDRVMINPGVPCYHCRACLKGDHPLCDSFMLLGEHLPGTLAERIALPEYNLAIIPKPEPPRPEITWVEAAAFPLVTLTAWRMLVTRARVRSGESVLIWGVGGGVSTAALMISKLMGAHAIVTSSSDAKLAAARQLGADVALNHESLDIVKEVRAITGRRGVDVVVENVGEATWERSLQLLGKRGRLVTCGATTGPRGTLDIRRMFWHQWSIMGSTMGSHAEFQEVVRLFGQGMLQPVIDSVFSLDDAAGAFARLQNGDRMGKVVVEIG